MIQQNSSVNLWNDTWGIEIFVIITLDIRNEKHVHPLYTKHNWTKWVINWAAERYGREQARETTLAEYTLVEFNDEEPYHFGTWF